MQSFFKIFFATLLALVVFTVIGVFVFGWFINNATTPNKPIVTIKTVLVIDLSKPLTEQRKEVGLSFSEGQTAAVEACSIG